LSGLDAVGGLRREPEPELIIPWGHFQKPTGALGPVVGLNCGVGPSASARSCCQAHLVAGRILVVDDNPHFLQTAAKLLALRGLNPFELAADGDEALVALGRGCPDGVLLDINLPGSNGFEVAATVAARCPTVPIVLMSSETDGVDDSQLTRCGATAFVPKTELATTDLGLLFGPGQD
jgi:CheY-like chemotaxis protein